MKAPARFPAIDVLRGLVMVLMTIDHASETFNRGRFVTDSIFLWKPHTEIPTAQFVTRWVTHLCAPTFVLLAGASLAMAVESRRVKGDDERTIDRYILSRGALIVLFELLWMSPVMLDPGRVLLQVLYAIGASLMCMAALRRLSDRGLLAVGFTIVLGGEAMIGVLRMLHIADGIPVAMLFSAGRFWDGRLIVAYPLLPWLGIMALGWVLGRRLMAWRAADGDDDRAPRFVTTLGLLSLAAFGVFRGIDGYGNMLLHRDDASILQWLHVSKYPPSVTYVALELGIALLLLGALLRITRSRPDFGGPLRLFGQVALFYYLLHIHLMHLASWALGLHERLGLSAAYGGAATVLVVLYPACRWYRAYKARHSTGFTRFV